MAVWPSTAKTTNYLLHLSHHTSKCLDILSYDASVKTTTLPATSNVTDLSQYSSQTTDYAPHQYLKCFQPIETSCIIFFEKPMWRLDRRLGNLTKGLGPIIKGNHSISQ